MIGIVNIGPVEGENPNDPFGWRYYEVRINQDVICTFKHKRSDGLGRSLLEASKAVEKKQWGDFVELTKNDRTTYLPSIVEGTDLKF